VHRQWQLAGTTMGSWKTKKMWLLLSGYCWIAQSGLQSSLVDWIVIANPKSKSDFGFGFSIQFLNPNPNNHIFYEETKNSCSILLQQ
jgi:hypothetical protein